MSDFPSSVPGPASITGGGVHDPFQELTFESGDEQVVPIFTKPRRKPVTLSWEDITLAEKDAIVTHREETRNETFSYTHPVTKVVMTCRYASDGLSWDESADKVGFYNVKATMKEIV